MVIIVHDLKDPNDPKGRTWKEINLEKDYEFPIGTLIEMVNGVRLFVVSHCRDCDGTPMYMLCSDPENTTPTINGWKNPEWDGPYGGVEEWKVIRGPKS